MKEKWHLLRALENNSSIGGRKGQKAGLRRTERESSSWEERKPRLEARLINLKDVKGTKERTEKEYERGGRNWD